MPATITSIFTMPMALQFSRRVQSLAHLLPGARSSGYTALLVLVMPITLAITFDEAHGVPPSGIVGFVAIDGLFQSRRHIPARYCLRAPPILLMFRVTHVSKSP